MQSFFGGNFAFNLKVWVFFWIVNLSVLGLDASRELLSERFSIFQPNEYFPVDLIRIFSIVEILWAFCAFVESIRQIENGEQEKQNKQIKVCEQFLVKDIQIVIVALVVCTNYDVNLTSMSSLARRHKLICGWLTIWPAFSTNDENLIRSDNRTKGVAF